MDAAAAKAREEGLPVWHWAGFGDFLEVGELLVAGDHFLTDCPTDTPTGQSLPGTQSLRVSG
jgi:hypothetical protein